MSTCQLILVIVYKQWQDPQRRLLDNFVVDRLHQHVSTEPEWWCVLTSSWLCYGWHGYTARPSTSKHTPGDGNYQTYSCVVATTSVFPKIIPRYSKITSLGSLENPRMFIVINDISNSSSSNSSSNSRSWKTLNPFPDSCSWYPKLDPWVCLLRSSRN